MQAVSISVRNMIAIVIGNALEWYDFVVYSFMTVVIARQFFPSLNLANSILATTATFGVAFCVRPLGGIVMGVYADRHGRKAALTIVIAIMTIALLMISFAPTYAAVGIFAPIFMVVARMLQGFSAGGQFGVSTSALIEMAPPHQRGYYGSWQMAGQMLAMWLGSIVGYIVTNVLSESQVESYGWRIPFMLGLLIAPVGLYLRSHLTEPSSQAGRLLHQKNHLWAEMRAHWRQVLVSMGLVVGGTVATYINVSYLPTYCVAYLHLPINTAFIALSVAVLVMVILIPIFGDWSDRIGRKKILVTSVLIYLIIIYPLFAWLVAEPSLSKLMIVELCSCLLLAAYFGVFAAAVAELFPMAIRSSGLGISYNLTVMVFGGFAQFIVTWLIESLHSPIAIVYYLIVSFAISFVAAIFYQDEKVA